jgi:YbbR domain-containing protein
MRWFAKNIRTLLIALILGFSVWISAVSAADPDEVRSPLIVPLDIVGQETSLIITNDVPSTIRVTLRAPRSVWEQLTAQENAVRAILDLTGLSAGEHELQVQVQIAVRPVQKILVEPETVTVKLEPLAIRTLPIVLSLSGQPAIGYQVGEATIEPTEVILSGPESLVSQAARARVFVGMDGVRESIEEALPIEILDDQNVPLEGILINPETARVIIPISQQGGFRDVAVKVVVQGQQAAGYQLENISVFPQVVTVFAEDPELVTSLPGIVETEPLDLQSANQNIATRLALNLPEGVEIVSPQTQTVQVQVAISPIQTSVTFLNQQITLIGLPEELVAEVFPKSVDVIISGPLPVLDALRPQDITVTVDVTGLEAGVHQLEPVFDPQVDNVLVQSILPEAVEVVLSLPPTPTPTPTAFPP